MATIPNTPEQGTSQNSAPSPNNHAEARPGKTPKELKPWQAWFTTLCIPFFISMFLCALLGLFVLTGKCMNRPAVCHTGLYKEGSVCIS